MDHDESLIQNAAANFQFAGPCNHIELYGLGHINRTYAVYCKSVEHRQHRYIMQRINKAVFTKPVELMENIECITLHLRQSVRKRGGNPDRESLTLIPSLNGNRWYVDPEGEYWRAYLFIEDSICLQTAENPLHLYQAARAFGEFQLLLNDFPSRLLHETIPNFHNTPIRLNTLREAMKLNPIGRLEQVLPEIDFVMQRQEEAAILHDALAVGRLPLRVTHNDTKLNNVMLDARTGEAVCVIDLDTVMPGSSLYDYGDAIRFGASSATEDEKALEKVWLDLEKTEAITRGYMAAAGRVLTDDEISMMPWGAKIMTFECGIRFLTDYLNGDRYFRIHYGDQNLNRARTQFKLVANMENKWPSFNNMVQNIHSEIQREWRKCP